MSDNIKAVIEDYVPQPKTPNPYAELVQALADAGEGKQATVTLPLDVWEREAGKIQDAAKAIDRGSRKVAAVIDEKTKTVTYSFRLGSRVHRTPKTDKAE